MGAIAEQVKTVIEGREHKVKGIYVSCEEGLPTMYKQYISTESTSASGKIFKVHGDDFEDWKRQFDAVSICPKFAPAIGDGMTQCYISDRVAYTVVDRTPTGHTLYLTRDNARQTGNYFGAQKWEYTPNTDPDAFRVKVRWNTRRERYMAGGQTFIFGRHAHEDPSF